ncbi:MAG: flagellar protein FlaG [Deltaproteobacteria bacterium]|nr:flagellar protein FlaG [Deltaproteobacteria bacterium]
MITPTVNLDIGKAGEFSFAYGSHANDPSRKDVSGTGPPASTAAVDTNTTQKITEAIGKNLESLNLTISFSRYGSNSQNIAIKILEKDTGKVVREIPPQEMQRLSAKMDELVGMIFNDMA